MTTPYFNINDYLTSNGINLSNINQNYVNKKLLQWSNQINSMTSTIYYEDNNIVEDILDFSYCNQDRIYFRPYQRDDFEVFISNDSIKWIKINENLDYKILTFNKLITVNNQLIITPIIGLDFRCLSSNCRCDKIKITGKKYFSSSLPDDLKNVLEDLLNNLLITDSNCYTNNLIPEFYQINNITSEKDLTNSINMYVDTTEIDRINSIKRNELNDTSFYSILSRYALTEQIFGTYNF